MSRMLAAAEVAEPTYPEQGRTLTGGMPAGYHHLNRGAVLGQGAETFAKASEGLQAWAAHQMPGARVFPPDAPLRVGATVVVTLGVRVAAIAVPCRIIAVVDEPGRFGFAYGTLPGHPEQGEEAFIISTLSDGTVRFDISAFSRPGDPLVRLAGPLGRRLQSIATGQYLRALSRFMGQSAPT